MAFDYRAPLSLTLCARFLAKQSCSSLFLPSLSCRLRLGDGELLALRSPESKFCSRVSGPFASRAFSSEKKTLARSVKAYDRVHGEIAVVTGDSWHDNVLCSDIPVLVEFWASWCGPCRMVHRELEDIARQYDGKIKCFMLKVDNDLEVADNYSVKAVPVVMLFKNGEKQSSVTGTMPKDFYVAEIEKLFAP